MNDLRTSILEVIRGDEQRIAQWLKGGRCERTHVFLGSCDYRMTAPPVFSQYGDNGLALCILTEVFRRNYQHMAGSREKHPWFQFCKVDCWYLADIRRNHCGSKFPVEWEYDWLIEVENEVKEFAHHLRGLLDFVANHRAVIFFSDDHAADVARLTPEFVAGWKPFVAKYGFARDFDLQAIFFPDTYTTFQQYSAGSHTYVWDGHKGSF